jgi:hypothetical protein
VSQGSYQHLCSHSHVSEVPTSPLWPRFRTTIRTTNRDLEPKTKDVDLPHDTWRVSSENIPDDEWRGDDHEEESFLDPLGLEALRRQIGEQLAQSMKPSIEALKFQHAPILLDTLSVHVDTSALDRMDQVVARAAAESFAKIEEILLSALPENLRTSTPTSSSDFTRSRRSSGLVSCGLRTLRSWPS